MKRSHWFINRSTPDDRYFAARFLQRGRDRFMKEGTPFYNRMSANLDSRLLYSARIEVVLQRERELQCAHMCAFDPTRVKPGQVVHLDCNVLRIWPDDGIEKLIELYTFKALVSDGFAAAQWAIGDRNGAHCFKLIRRKYEQALIKLKRERDRRKRVYNLS